MKEERKLRRPACFINVESGDLMIVWYRSNFPNGEDWIRISKLAYDNLTKSIFGRIGDK